MIITYEYNMNLVNLPLGKLVRLMAGRQTQKTPAASMDGIACSGKGDLEVARPAYAEDELHGEAQLVSQNRPRCTSAAEQLAAPAPAQDGSDEGHMLIPDSQQDS